MTADTGASLAGFYCQILSREVRAKTLRRGSYQVTIKCVFSACAVYYRLEAPKFVVKWKNKMNFAGDKRKSRGVDRLRVSWFGGVVWAQERVAGSNGWRCRLSLETKHLSLCSPLLFNTLTLSLHYIFSSFLMFTARKQGALPSCSQQFFYVFFPPPDQGVKQTEATRRFSLTGVEWRMQVHTSFVAKNPYHKY